MTNEQTREALVTALMTNAYLNMCESDDMKNAISAIDKQIPKKPYKVKEKKQNEYYCIVCNRYLGDEMELKYTCLQPEYCQHCGQAIDWSDM